MPCHFVSLVCFVVSTAFLGSRNSNRRFPVQLLDFLRQPFRLLLQFGAFLVEQSGPPPPAPSGATSL
jgi:hypothetical protein